MSPRRRKLKTHVAGKRATATEPSSSVRVYQRPDVPGVFLSCAWDTTASGRPREMKLPEGLSWEAAVATAEVTAARRRAQSLEGRDAMGRPKRVTLGAVLEGYHGSARALRWGRKHGEEMDRWRRFWTAHIGAGRPMGELTPAEIQRVAREAADRRGWGPRTERKVLAYIRAADRWAATKARLYPAPELRGMDFPPYSPETERLIYTRTETPALLAGHPDADWRDTLAVSVAADTGRRISAILALRVEDVFADEGAGQVLLRFRAQSDKAGRSALVPVSRPTAARLAAALLEGAVMDGGWIFPEGRLDYDDPRDKPRSKESALKGLHRLEELVGVERIPGRGFHGLKRTHVTAAMEVSHGDATLVGDVTGNADARLIQRVYRRGSVRRSAGVVDGVRRVLEAGEGAAEPTQVSPEDGRSVIITAAEFFPDGVVYEAEETRKDTRDGDTEKGDSASD